jgi:hypothetical protein
MIAGPRLSPGFRSSPGCDRPVLTGLVNNPGPWGLCHVGRIVMDRPVYQAGRKGISTGLVEGLLTNDSRTMATETPLLQNRNDFLPGFGPVLVAIDQY